MNFYSPKSHFEVLETLVLPQLVQKPEINIWSAACSNGAEPYSISIFMMSQHKKVNIIASDASQDMLKLAIRGEYEKIDVEGVPKAQLQECFRRGVGDAVGQFRIHDFLRQSVQFYQHDLLTPFMMPIKFDVIFCQNVLGRVNDPEKEKIEDNLIRALQKGGYLFIGVGETLFHDKGTRVAPSVYRYGEHS